MREALEPVAGALVAAAHDAARTERALAETDARAQIAEGRAQAEAFLAEARAEGTEAATQRSALQLAVSRREAQEIVLAARLRVYEALRNDAIEALELRADAPEGRLLGERIAALVLERVGAPATVRRFGPGRLAAVAKTGSRQAVLGPAALVDRALVLLAEEIEALWA